jgi:putative transposase
MNPHGTVLSVQLRYQFRVHPTPGQQIELARAFGCARVVFNDGLRLRQQAREQGLPYVSDAELSKQVITQAKTTPQRAWLGEVSAVVLQQALADLNTAYRNFFASITGKRKGRRVAPPRFRSRKDNRQAIRFTKNSRFKVLGNGRLSCRRSATCRCAGHGRCRRTRRPWRSSGTRPGGTSPPSW